MTKNCTLNFTYPVLPFQALASAPTCSCLQTPTPTLLWLLQQFTLSMEIHERLKIVSVAKDIKLLFFTNGPMATTSGFTSAPWVVESRTIAPSPTPGQEPTYTRAKSRPFMSLKHALDCHIHIKVFHRKIVAKYITTIITTVNTNN